jgi:hypothetical protein
LLYRCTMAIMATESATSSKKPGSHESHGERDARRAPPREVGKSSGEKGSHKPGTAESENVDDDVDDRYDNVACTD